MSNEWNVNPSPGIYVSKTNNVLNPVVYGITGAIGGAIGVEYEFAKSSVIEKFKKFFSEEEYERVKEIIASDGIDPNRNSYDDFLVQILRELGKFKQVRIKALSFDNFERNGKSIIKRFLEFRYFVLIGRPVDDFSKLYEILLKPKPNFIEIFDE